MPLPSGVTALHWFRNDLRLDDNPALKRASESGAMLAIFIDETDGTLRPRGGAQGWFLHHALARLGESLREKGSDMIILRGESRVLVPRVAAAIGAGLVTWNRRYGAAEREIDAGIKADLKAQDISAESYNGHLLYEPMEIRSQAGGPMRVFTPFWRACRAKRPVEAPLSPPETLPPLPAFPDLPGRVTLDDLGLLPTKPDWAGGLRETWEPGEAGARKRLLTFLTDGLKGYAEDRNRPDLPSTSMLSPHLAMGDISVRRIWQVTEQALQAGETRGSANDVEKFFSELGWREFAHHLLYHYPTLASVNYQPKFNAFPWDTNAKALSAWQKGLTGYPIVDAGMRQLWQTGFMHNRVRMIVASFLIKHLLIDWREGEKWFWDTLCDADPANNPASWQWVAGSGADAAPYFRIFNPITQGEKFDPDGNFVRAYIPEIAKLPAKMIHRPWEAPGPVLIRAGIRLGETYPRPIVSHEDARERALEAFKSLPAAASHAE
ncbi:MAG: DNA photolyase family protein [Beijerinckiaceae bacterium]|nr:DNA photolyase family protein [Beijerinckiaceae bacterium]